MQRLCPGTGDKRVWLPADCACRRNMNHPVFFLIMGYNPPERLSFLIRSGTKGGVPMTSRHFIPACVLIFLAFIMISCSGGGDLNNVVDPPVSPDISSAGISPDGNFERYLWGYFSISYDLDENTRLLTTGIIKKLCHGKEVLRKDLACFLKPEKE